jgi:hypothetical protein
MSEFTIEAIEKQCGEPASAWVARCYEIACHAAKLYDGAVAVYGHWLGDVEPESFFGSSRMLPFIQHGWVLLADGRILDPTRWVFEAVEPYIWAGENDGSYDEGGNGWRKAMHPDAPAYDPHEEQVDRTKVGMLEWVALVRLAMGEQADMQEPLCFPQLLWVANLPPADMGALAPDVYRALDKMKLLSLMPLDNRRTIERRHGI